jgi:FkbM family methyltransferase
MMSKVSKVRRRLFRVLTRALALAIPERYALEISKELRAAVRYEGNDDPTSNGEYFFLRSLAAVQRSSESVVFDCGANIGDWSLFACSCFRTGCIYSFEPAEFTYRELVARLEEVGTSAKVIPIKHALGKVTAVSEFYYCAELPGMSTLHTRQLPKKTLLAPVVEQVSVLTGDEFCKSRGITTVDFIKIDTEGNDLNVILGFQGMLKAGQIKCIQFEYGGAWLDARCFLLDAYVMLKEYGYTVAKLLPNGIEVLTEFDCDEESFGYSNYVAILPGPFGELKSLTNFKIIER